MKITHKYIFAVPVYGTAPAISYDQVLKDYLENLIDKHLLTFAQQSVKKGEKAEDLITKILSVFHRDDENRPVIGNWMIRQCLIKTGEIIFNAKENKTHPPKTRIPSVIQLVEPYLISLTNGQIIQKPDGVKTYAVTTEKRGTKRSFFKAYEYILKGCQMEFTAIFDDDFISPELAEWWIDKAGQVGTGGFRERFGKFMKVPAAKE